MKKILIYTLIIVLIPFFIITYLNNNKLEEIELKYISNRTVRVKRLSKDIIEEIPLEEYVVGVLAGEMPTYFNLEALKAQAVASRTYVLKKQEYNKDNDYDVVDSVLNQVYLDNEYLKEAWKDNYTVNINKLRKAVNETIDEYIEYNGEIIEALFFSTSNGYTEDSNIVFGFDAPYLKSVESSWDKEMSTAYSSTKNILLSDFYSKLNLEYKQKLDIEIINQSNTNRIITLKINGTTFKATDVYNMLALKSTDFEIIQNGNIVTINMKGYGHGVGMSQYGAEGMAEVGYKYDEILSHYYLGTNLKKLQY